MCDLLGISFRNPINARISLDAFQISGDKNPDGWGLGYYKGEILQVIKEAEPAIQSGLYDFLEAYTESKLYISHVRRSTRGSRSYLNTHPFYRKLIINGLRCEWLFAHNGTLNELAHLDLTKLNPLGETDSEHAFCYILQSIFNCGITSWTNDDFVFIESILRDINSKQNELNCIFSNGSLLFCYSDENKHNNGLRYMKKYDTSGKIDLVSQGAKLGLIDIQSASVSGSMPQENVGYIIVTRELSGENWVEFDDGELIVFKDGCIVYPSDRGDHT
jgi:predicted glutamine amidotransferase